MDILDKPAKTNIKDTMMKKKDNYIKVFKTKVLFNITTDISGCNEYDDVFIEFGIFNNLFKSMIKGYFFKKYELEKFYNILKKIIYKNKNYNKTFCFIDSTIKFTFISHKNDISLELRYEIPNSGDDYIVNMSIVDIFNLYSLINRQIQNDISGIKKNCYN